MIDKPTETPKRLPDGAVVVRDPETYEQMVRDILNHPGVIGMTILILVEEEGEARLRLVPLNMGTSTVLECLKAAQKGLQETIDLMNATTGKAN